MRVLLNRLISGFRRLFHATQVEQELDEEVRTYLETAVEQKMSAGMTREAAVRAARVEMGSLEAVKDWSRDVGWESSLETFWRDAAYALRRLRKSPGFAFAAIVTLALGIGANTAIFSVLHATSLSSSAFRDPDRVAMIWTTPSGHPETNEGARIVEYLAWKEQSQTFDHIGTMLGWSSNLGSTRDGEPADRLSGWRFTASLFQALGVQPQLGRLFTEDDDRTDGPSNVAVISYRLWQNRFGGDLAVVGRTMLLDGTATTIVGVIPSNFRFFDGGESDFWIPMNFTGFQLQARGTNRVLTVVGHLHRGVSIERAQADIDAVAARFAKEDPGPQQGRGIRVQLFDEALLGNVRRLLRVLQGAVAFVLLIACANVAGLLLIRAASQQREVAIRSSLGASRTRIVRQFLTESLVLSAAGGILGLAMAWWGLRLMVTARPTWLSAVQKIEIDSSVLALSTAVSLLTGLAFGIVPALQVPTCDLVARLKQSTRADIGGRGHRRLRSTLVTGQVALTLVLLVGAGLLIKSFWQLQRADLGFEPNGVLSFQSRLPANKYFRQVGVKNGFAQLDVSPVPAMLFDRVVERLQQVPGVQSVAGTTVPPVPMGALQAPFTIEGRPAVDAADAREALSAAYSLVTPNFFVTMRIPILRGRDFSERDTATAVPVAIINQAMARRFWPNEDPIGKRLTVTIVSDERPREIIAVVGDTPVNRFQRTPAPALYVPQLQESSRYRVPFGQSRVQMTFVLRITQPPDAVVPAVRRAVADVDASLPVSQVQMVADYLARQVDVPRDSMLLIGAFGALALLLAAFGIYGVVAYGVLQRTHEIGIRMALGARRAQVLGLVLRQSTVLTLVGMLLGLAGACVVTRSLENLLFGITPLDLTTFGAVSLTFVVTATVASFMPARRATKVDPLVALRYE